MLILRAKEYYFRIARHPARIRKLAVECEAMTDRQPKA
jgi:hypothetical protein